MVGRRDLSPARWGQGRSWALLGHSCPGLHLQGPNPSPPSLTLQDAAYHCTAALFYLSASVLEALATIQMHEGFKYKQYHENISAVVSPAHPHAHGSPRPDWVPAEGCPGPHLLF